MKKCPILLKRGFLNKKGKLRSEKNWIEEACHDCPLEKMKGYCVYEKDEPISQEDMEILLGDGDE